MNITLGLALFVYTNNFIRSLYVYRMQGGNGQFSVPPGFRFHPTDEELLYYYLRKKVSCEAIDLDVITEVDLNKLEPWDLKGKRTLFLCL